MDMNTVVKRIHELAGAHDKLLRSTDPKFDGAVQVVHEDGSVLFFETAYAVLWNEPVPEKEAPPDWRSWLVVFTKHHGFVVFLTDDLSSWRAYKHIQVTESEIA